jgi:hypothetical protein
MLRWKKNVKKGIHHGQNEYLNIVLARINMKTVTMRQTPRMGMSV